MMEFKAISLQGPATLDRASETRVIMEMTLGYVLLVLKAFVSLPSNVWRIVYLSQQQLKLGG